MSKRTKLIEKYRKSDIFNLSSQDIKPERNTTYVPYLSNKTDAFKEKTNKDNKKKLLIPHKKYVRKHHDSDIFNLNNTQPENNNKPQKIRNAHNYSSCFDSMKDNIQFANEIKEYAQKNRRLKSEYNPLKYFHEENAKERLYSQFYDKNPIIHSMQKNKSMMKSSANLFSKMNIDVNNNNTTKDKKTLENDIENGFKTHKYYKTKGITFLDTESSNRNINNNHKFLLTDNLNNNINNSKINKQLQLQSNIFNDENLTKNGNDINKIKQRIQLAEKSNETKPKNHFFHFKTTSNILTEKTDDKNIWGSLHNNWEKYNIDWLKDNTEIVFNKNSLNKDDNITAFDRKMNQLSDSNYKDTINESIKVNRKNNDFRKRDKYLSNLEQIDEILNDIPTLKYDKKKQILFYSNTTGLNGESNIDKNLTNYNKYHKINLDKKVKKEPTIKIMSKESQNHIDNKKKEQKFCSNLNKYDTYNIHDYILSYDTRKVVKGKNNVFNKLDENEVKLLFSKNGLHIYDIKKNIFNNGKYNTIKFKVRENEGEQALNEKIKKIENIFNEKECKVNIKKEEEKNVKKNLRNVAKAPFTKRFIFINENDKNNSKLNEKNKNKTFRKNTAFSNQYGVTNSNYKNHYKEEQLKNKVNK